jgi:hypothetical protein
VAEGESSEARSSQAPETVGQTTRAPENHDSHRFV